MDNRANVLQSELGPCHVNSSFESYLNPHSWNEVSNLLFLSQPLGVGKSYVTESFFSLQLVAYYFPAGFSYSDTENGSLNPVTGVVENSTFDGVKGRYPKIDATLTGKSFFPVRMGLCRLSNEFANSLDTTELAAYATWEVLQGFLGGLPQLDSKIKSKDFSLWTESYGGLVFVQSPESLHMLTAFASILGITDRL